MLSAKRSRLWYWIVHISVCTMLHAAFQAACVAKRHYDILRHAPNARYHNRSCNTNATGCTTSYTFGSSVSPTTDCQAQIRL